MLFEIAYLDKHGELSRGGVAATIRTVGKWIEESVLEDPDTVYVAVPAGNDAITIAECKRMIRDGDSKEIKE